jgi:hypothetical protein
MRVMIIQHFHGTDRDAAERLCRMEKMLGTIIEKLEMFGMSFQELKDALVAADAKADAIKADVVLLMEKLAAIPVGGMTPEQEALLAEANALAASLNSKLGDIDAMNP